MYTEDLLENSDLSALAHSRLGLKQFVNDGEKHVRKVKQHVALTGNSEEFFNLFGSKKRKDSIQDVRNEQNARWSKYKVDSCAGVQKLIDEIAIDIEKTTKIMASSNAFYLQPQLETAREWEAKAKTIQSQMDCVNKLAAEKQASERASVLDTLTNISDSTVAKAKNDLGLGISAKNEAPQTIAGVDKKVVVYGGIGLAALLIIGLIGRR
jgi:hypothetical protein